MSWVIKGQAGKALNATERAPEALLIEQLTVKFTSLAIDTMTWSSATENIAAGGTIIPEYGQRVELYWNDVRKFRGDVTGIKVQMDRVVVTVSGPQWWMQQTPLTSVIADGAGTESERVSLAFKTQGLATSIRALILRAKELGCPIDIGNIATMYRVPRITLDDTDCLSALASLMRWCPDAVAWVDYSAEIPKMHFTRRGAATALNLSATGSDLEMIDIEPMLSLQVSQVDAKYVMRDTETGRPKWASQRHGTAANGKRQIITISGPEISTLLPKDDFDTYKAKTTSNTTSFVNSTEPAIVAAKEKWGSNNVGVGVGSGQTVAVYREATSNMPGGTLNSDLSSQRLSTTFPAPSFVDRAGNIVSLNGKHFLLSERPPEWVSKVPNLRVIEGTLSGSIFGYIFANQISAGNFAQMSAPDWFGDLGIVEVLDGFQGSPAQKIRYYSRLFSMPAILLTQAYPTETTLYKPWDYDFLSPPDDLSENLQAAQDWVPWRGTIERVVDEVSAASNILGRPINLTDSIAATATMKALMRSITYGIQSGSITYELGAPARNDYQSLVSKIRRDPKDNIVYL